MKLNTNTSEALKNLDRGHTDRELAWCPPGGTHGSTAGGTPAATEGGEGAQGPAPARERDRDQLELGLRANASGRPHRVVKTRRYAVARWWFARMRETVRSTREWDGGDSRRAGTEQGMLTLTQSPTRFEGRRAA